MHSQVRIYFMRLAAEAIYSDTDERERECVCVKIYSCSFCSFVIELVGDIQKNVLDAASSDD
jgi:hypothetical protein